MIELPRPRPGAPQVVRSQIALELCLNLYALLGVAILARCLLLALGVDRRLWIGALVYRATDLLALPLTLLPGASRTLIGDAALPDLTLLALLVLVPLGALARAPRRPREG